MPAMCVQELRAVLWPPLVFWASTLARFRRRSTHVPNLIDELSPAKERRLNQFGTAVLIWCGNVVKFDKVCRIIRHWSGN